MSKDKEQEVKVGTDEDLLEELVRARNEIAGLQKELQTALGNELQLWRMVGGSMLREREQRGQDSG